MTQSTTGKKSRNAKPCHNASEGAPHPDHSYALGRLRKIQGQLNGIESMIHDGRYCVDILIQFRASMSALRNLEALVFETHLKHCVADAMQSRDPLIAERKIQELTELLAKRTQV